MSKSQAIAFFEEISKNNKLAKEVEKVVGGKKSDEAKAKELISLAKKYNFNFTQKEAASAQGSLKKSLSPEEMLEVNGGKGGLKSSFMAMALLAGLGVGGAAMSSMEASAMDGGRQQEIQVPEGQAPAEQQEVNTDERAEGSEKQQAVSAATLSYNYIRTVFHQLNTRPADLLQSVNVAVLEEDLREMVDLGWSPTMCERARDLMSPCFQRVSDNQRFDSEFFKACAEVQRLAHEYGMSTLWREDGEPAEALLSSAAAAERNSERFRNYDDRYNLRDLANEASEVSARTAAGYRVLAARIQTNGGVVDDDILNELINLRIAELDAEYGFTDAEREAMREAEEERARLARQGTVSGTPQMIQARGNQHIEAGPNTHVHSFSDNELIHEGAGLATITGTGAVDIDAGDITISECNEDLSRNVTVNQANSLTVAPNVPMRTQNGTEFTMGATREETIDNLIPDIQPSAYQERNTQQRNLNFNNPRLQRMLAWAMERFGLSGQDLIDFVQHFFIQGG